MLVMMMNQTSRYRLNKKDLKRYITSDARLVTDTDGSDAVEATKVYCPEANTKFNQQCSVRRH